MSTFTKRILTLLLSIAMVLSLAVPAYAATGATPSDTDIVVPLPGPGDYLSSQTQAAVQLRSGMKARQQTVVLKVMTTRADYEAFAEELFEIALEHTGNPTEGDYLRWQIGGYEAEITGTTDGTYSKLTMTYNMTYYTTAAQEAMVDQAVAAYLAQLDLSGASDLDKITGVYEAMCAQIEYDDDAVTTPNTLAHTAYAALVEGKAVCQGYAVLFYRAMLELGVDARVIVGKAGDVAHAWNIVEYNGEYYNMDATWDAARVQASQAPAYFMKSEVAFADHVRDEAYTTEAFNAAYPMATSSYGASDAVVGDMNGDDKVDVSDAIRLLLFITMPNDFPLDAAADFNGDNNVDVSDAIRLLLFITMPNDCPLG